MAGVSSATGALGADNAVVSCPAIGQSGGCAIAAGTLAATLTPVVSYDAGASWVASSFLDPNTGAATATLVLTNPNAASNYGILLQGGVTNFGVQCHPYTSGTCNVTVTSTTEVEYTGGTITATADGATAAKVAEYVPGFIVSGGTVTRRAAPSSTGQNAVSLGSHPGSVNYLTNGSTLDAQQGNQALTLLSSAARTTAPSVGNQVNYNHRGVQVRVNVTAYTAGGLTIAILGVDSISGATYALSAALTKIAATGLYVYEIYPGAGTAVGGITAVSSHGVPRTWTVTATPDDTTSITYSISAAFLL